MPDRETIARYDTSARDYAERFTRDAPHPRLIAFLDRLPPAAHILDLGCGPGDSAAHMQALGHRPDPLDASAGMAAEAKARFGLDVRVGDFADLKGPYDAVWASFSLLHMPRADLPGYLIRLATAIRPGGCLSIAMKTGTGEARDRIGRRYSYTDPEELSGWLRAAGFSPEAPVTGIGKGLAGTEEPWFALIATRLDPPT